MDKKTKTIVIVLISIVVIGILSYGYNRWRQEQLATQLIKSMYGVDAGKLGNFTGGISNKLSVDIAAEIAKNAAEEEKKQKEEDAREAAKTPEDKFNETKSVALTGETSSLVKDMVEPQLTAVFGKIKPTLYNGGYMSQQNSFLVVFKVPKVPTSEDFNKLVEEFTNSGYTAVSNSIAADSANLLMEKNGSTLSVSCENPENQEVGIVLLSETNQ